MKGLLKRWFIDGMSFMALGLFSSLLIGLIIKTIGTYIPALSGLIPVGELAMSLTGAAIGASIAYGLKAHPLVVFSAVTVGYSAYEFGGVAGSFIAVLVATELSRLYAGRTKLDILISPIFTIVIGFLVGKFVGPFISKLMLSLGSFVNFAVEQNPFIMGMLVALVFGITLTAPISSAALAVMIDINGLAAAAAAVGCCCHMVGLALMSYKDNGSSGVLSIGLGTSMLQVANIIKNPWIILPPSIASVIIAPIMTVFFPMQNNSAGAGMGTSGLVGQIMAIETMGPSMTTYIMIIIFHILLPGAVTYAFYKLLMSMKLIKPGDQVLNLGNQ
ncbi:MULTISPECIES: PTS transporter subunit IIC [Nosocomiicoccus]|uniref:PTS sugar transporter subunit IIC n=1 Tax=Nosocomiicoccus massiliensis TaxID=1232430 RepID=A0AAF1BS83_9STAP|nr:MULTISPECIES: PTS sugar transporter subunit IIC [Nosocomiicoccus]MDK6863222.1 PTS sugar transporter subunit IIC [Nosocomiicoccus ampullae]OFL46293.1 PTS sugar transporter subunit IIC [Nosocomiicoccus sp. HMSC067E10]WOS96713.1 PTS sugar transporter subunit IIC [Nosocomiicoccus massiliensis]